MHIDKGLLADAMNCVNIKNGTYDWDLKKLSKVLEKIKTNKLGGGLNRVVDVSVNMFFAISDVNIALLCMVMVLVIFMLSCLQLKPKVRKLPYSAKKTYKKYKSNVRELYQDTKHAANIAMNALIDMSYDLYNRLTDANDAFHRRPLQSRPKQTRKAVRARNPKTGTYHSGTSIHTVFRD